MHLDSLEYLLTVAKQGSFTKAAKSISISQQGLSKSIKHLEDEIGIKLLDRSEKSVVLTKEGIELLPEIEGALKAYDDFRKAARRIRKKGSGQDKPVRILVNAFFSVRLLPALSEDLSSINMDNILISEMELTDIVKRVRQKPHESAGMVNTTPSFEDDLPKDDSICFEKLFSIRMMICASTKLLSPRIKVLTRKQLADLPISYYNAPLLKESIKPFLDYYKPTNIISHTSNEGELFNMAAAGKTALISDTLTAYINRDNRNLVFFPIDKAVFCNVGFIYSLKPEIGEGQRRYIDAVRECLKMQLKNYIKRNPPV
jgi:DNA-binding transcriptional LysR family regulator